MRADEIVEVLLANEAGVGPTIVSELLAILIAAREHFADLEEWTIFLAVVSRSTELADEEARAADLPPGWGTNVRSLADSCQLPRETVRRKVQKLLERGYVARHGDRLLATRQGRERLRPLALQVYRGVARVRMTIDKVAAPEAEGANVRSRP